MSRLSKLERHLLRRAVRKVGMVTERDLAEMHPQEVRIARAEMRKRRFEQSVKADYWYRS